MKEKISLYVLAAGMGSRYGGLKQMEGFGPNGETIIDYSIYDAIQSGFDKIVFVIRKDMEEPFNEIFMKKYRDRIDMRYVFQSIDMLPQFYKMNPERTKPWGTGHAFLVGEKEVNEPTFVISSDDFYGRDTFKTAAQFLREECIENLYSIPVYPLHSVLSDYGTVKRGICTEENGVLVEIHETFEVGRSEDGIIRGKRQTGEEVILDENAPVAMSSYALHHTVLPKLETRFNSFLENIKDELTSEYLLPEILSAMVKDNEIEIKLTRSKGEWFGVTYQEDAPIARQKLRELVDRGEYPENLME